MQASVRKSLPQEFEKLAFSTGIEAWMKAVYACNQYVDEQAPWALKKTDPDRMRTVLQTLFIALRDLAIAIQPVIPEKAGHLLDMLGIADDARSFEDLADEGWYGALIRTGYRVEPPKPLFPRLELPEADSAEAG